MKLPVAAAVLAAAAVSAQGRTARVFVFANDASGAPVTDLTRSEVDIRDHGSPARVLAFRRGTDPIRLVVIVNIRDSAETGRVKRGLDEMLASVPDDVEAAVVMASGECAPRAAPTTDRARQKAAVNALRDEGGQLARTLMACEEKLFRDEPARWPIYAIVTDDTSEDTSAVKQMAFDAFSDRVSASSTVHVVLTKEGGNSQTGKIIDALARNLTANTRGSYQEVSGGRGLPEAIAAVGKRVAADSARMAAGYEVSYERVTPGDDGGIEIGTSRAGVVLRPSVQRIPDVR